MVTGGIKLFDTHRTIYILLLRWLQLSGQLDKIITVQEIIKRISNSITK